MLHTPKINLIYAHAHDMVMGFENALPWGHIRDDMLHFRRTTGASPVIMGRKTWESLPSAARPLPDRLNFVLTRDARWSAPGCIAVPSLESALHWAGGAAYEEVWVIGGRQLLDIAIPYASKAVVTEIFKKCDGDVFAPSLGPSWSQVSEELHHETTSRPAIAFKEYTQLPQKELPKWIS